MSGPDTGGEEAPDRDLLRRVVARLHAVHTDYPKLQLLMRDIVDLIKRDNRASEGAIQVLIGPSRSGKTHFLDDLLRGYPRREKGIVLENGDFADEIPVAIVQVRDTSVKTFAERIYEAISGMHPEDVFGSRYKEDKVMREIIRLARECGLKLLILDEAHESVDKKTDRAASSIAVLLKNLANARLFSILVVGTGRALRLIEAEAEVRSRVHVIHSLEPFGTSQADMQDWSDVVSDMDDYLAANVFGCSSGLAAPAMAEILRVAARGIVGEAATLVENAAYSAVDDMLGRPSGVGRAAEAGDGSRQPGIGLHHLEAAFDAWAPGVGRVNPFRPGTLPLQAEAPYQPDEGPLSGVRGRTRSNTRDSQFRK